MTTSRPCLICGSLAHHTRDHAGEGIVDLDFGIAIVLAVFALGVIGSIMTALMD